MCKVGGGTEVHIPVRARGMKVAGGKINNLDVWESCCTSDLCRDTSFIGSLSICFLSRHGPIELFD